MLDDWCLIALTAHMSYIMPRAFQMSLTGREQTNYMNTQTYIHNHNEITFSTWYIYISIYTIRIW